MKGYRGEGGNGKSGQAYSAGYYGYKWSEVLSADVFAAFEEAGLDNEEAVRKTGRRYRDTILALGGGTHPSEVFRLFRGRDPSIMGPSYHTPSPAFNREKALSPPSPLRGGPVLC